MPTSESTLIYVWKICSMGVPWSADLFFRMGMVSNSPSPLPLWWRPRGSAHGGPTQAHFTIHTPRTNNALLSCKVHAQPIGKFPAGEGTFELGLRHHLLGLCKDCLNSYFHQFFLYNLRISFKETFSGWKILSRWLRVQIDQLHQRISVPSLPQKLKSNEVSFPYRCSTKPWKNEPCIKIEIAWITIMESLQCSNEHWTSNYALGLQVLTN